MQNTDVTCSRSRLGLSVSFGKFGPAFLLNPSSVHPRLFEVTYEGRKIGHIALGRTKKETREALTAFDKATGIPPSAWAQFPGNNYASLIYLAEEHWRHVRLKQTLGPLRRMFTALMPVASLYFVASRVLSPPTP